MLIGCPLIRGNGGTAKRLSQAARQAASVGAYLEWPCDENSRFSDEPVAKATQIGFVFGLHAFSFRTLAIKSKPAQPCK